MVLLVIFLISCGGPDALVINTVNRDGSVDRSIILTYHKDEFDLDKCQVPVDSSWTINKDIEISEKVDTIWTLTAAKHFDSVDQINVDYENYAGTNSGMIRRADFSAKFRWFNTIYTYSETVEKAINGQSPETVFTPREINIFYMPESMVDELLSGVDSIYYEQLTDSLDKKVESWLGSSLLITTLSEMESLNGQGVGEPVDIQKLRDSELLIVSSMGDSDFDEEVLLDSIMGKGFYENNKVLIDSAMDATDEKLSVAFEADSYLMQVVMPGRLIATNGYLDSDTNIIWEVSGESFLTSDYIMWAESGVVNVWAWICSFAFLLFVISGLIIRRRRNRSM